MAGVINLRGSVVPVVDLRLCFEMSKTENTRNTCIVVVEVVLDNESTVIGALADSVEEVIDLEPEQIEPAPRIGTQIRTDFIKRHGQARHAVHHDSGHRSRLLGRGTGRGPRAGIRQGPRSKQPHKKGMGGPSRPILPPCNDRRRMHVIPGLFAPPRTDL